MGCPAGRLEHSPGSLCRYRIQASDIARSDGRENIRMRSPVIDTAGDLNIIGADHASVPMP
jgi:hypothetical protein